MRSCNFRAVRKVQLFVLTGWLVSQGLKDVFFCSFDLCWDGKTCPSFARMTPCLCCQFSYSRKESTSVSSHKVVGYSFRICRLNRRIFNPVFFVSLNHPSTSPAVSSLQTSAGTTALLFLNSKPPATNIDETGNKDAARLFQHLLQYLLCFCSQLCEKSLSLLLF